ncbi:putative cytochrome P450 monooxygenase [Pseudovirgaria hyperparasitica]|uniref:Putative cytochrome P450 monooxygenase n=1 Tax=Pseudovirgaria hyperparasitica TaxID=470096 RepID=A0A6A6VX68_9PEZI|nr:putative cytochrome P450 monooxygenase [Pseudovirgaria hyperparasitica]KAF2753857.1 putative cytochrome P450 monooxygenase [Pseudovirgaria hyperparasitica]
MSAMVDRKGLFSLPEAIEPPCIVAYIVAVAIAYRVIYQCFFSPLRNIPGSFLSRLSAKHSIVKRIFSNGSQSVQNDYETYGDIYVHRPDGVSISHPQDIKKILTSQDFRKTDVYRMLDILGHPSIFTARDPIYASLRRRQLGPYLTHGFLNQMEPLIVRHSIQAIRDKWDMLIDQNEGNPIIVNYRNDTQYATFDTIGALAFGRDFSALSNDDDTIIRWIEATGFYLGMTKNLPLLGHWPFSRLLRRSRSQFHAFIRHSNESIDIRRRKLLNGAKERPIDLLQAFLDAEDPDSKIKMQRHEVRTESIALQLAGSESTSFVTSWVIHLLTLYPAYHARAVDEVRSLFKRDHMVTFAECRTQLPFLEACVYETLRYSPITSGFMPRVSHTSGVMLQGFYLPPGIEVAINLIGAHNHAETWKDPHIYDPTRFLANEDLKRNVFAFSYGHRNCIGKSLAWSEMMVILSNLLKDYDVKLPEDTVYGPKNLDELGRPKIMETKSTLFTTPKYPDRDCRLLVKKAFA